MIEPTRSVTLPPCRAADQEALWLRQALQTWLDAEFLPEPVNQVIAQRATQVFLRQRLEGENELNALVMAILTEMQQFDFSSSFYSEFAVANAVGELLLSSLGMDTCCGS